MKNTKKTKVSIYKLTAFMLMVLYLAFLLIRTIDVISDLPEKRLLLAFGYVVSLSAPVFVSLEAMIFAARGIMEFAKLKTNLPKRRAIPDIFFGGVGLFTLCLYIGVHSDILESNGGHYVSAGVVLICLYWVFNITLNMYARYGKAKK